MVHSMANVREHVISGARQHKRPAPICATSDNIEVCVQETIVRKYGPGPLEQARKLLDKTDLRAAGLAVATVAIWKFIQRRRRKRNERKNEGQVVEALEGKRSTDWDRFAKSKLPADNVNVAADERKWGKDRLQGADEQVWRGQWSTKPENAGVRVPLDRGLSPAGTGSEGFDELEETRRALKLDLEESAAERRAAEEGLRQGFGRQLVLEERGGPGSSAGTPPLEATSPKPEDSPVAALLAKAKATSEKVDRIHERLRRLSKGDAPK